MSAAPTIVNVGYRSTNFWVLSAGVVHVIVRHDAVRDFLERNVHPPEVGLERGDHAGPAEVHHQA